MSGQSLFFFFVVAALVILLGLIAVDNQGRLNEMERTLLEKTLE